jgi:WD repeat-containing protein 26
MDPDSSPPPLTLLCNKSFTWPPRALVGVDLDQKITSRVPRYVRSVFLNRPLPFHIRIRTGWILLQILCILTDGLSTQLQSHVTSTLTTVFTAFTSFGLVAVSAWFASERWIFLRHRGQKWLSDALMEYKDMLMSLPGIEFARQVFHAVGRLFERAHECICRVFSKALELVYTYMNKSTADHDLEANIPPIVHVQNERPPLLRHISDGEKSIMTVDTRKALSISVTGLQSDKLSDIPQTPATPTPISPGKQLWRNAMRSVKMHSATSSSFGIVVSPREPQRQSTSSSTLTAGDRNRTNGGGEPVRAVFRSRVAALVPKLKVLETTQDLAAHQALVRHLEFSPDGRYLATSR